jgi:hypothetical protein
LVDRKYRPPQAPHIARDFTTSQGRRAALLQRMMHQCK